MPAPEEKLYRDIPISFTAHPVTGNVKMLENFDAVKQSVKNIVLTNFYEKPYNPLFGGDVISQLFENADRFTEFTIKKNISDAIRNHEPRAILDDVVVKSKPDENNLSARIVFRLKNSKEPITLNVILERVR